MERYKSRRVVCFECVVESLQVDEGADWTMAEHIFRDCTRKQRVKLGDSIDERLIEARFKARDAIVVVRLLRWRKVFVKGGSRCDAVDKSTSTFGEIGEAGIQ